MSDCNWHRFGAWPATDMLACKQLIGTLFGQRDLTPPMISFGGFWAETGIHIRGLTAHGQGSSGIGAGHQGQASACPMARRRPYDDSGQYFGRDGGFIWVRIYYYGVLGVLDDEWLICHAIGNSVDAILRQYGPRGVYLLGGGNVLGTYHLVAVVEASGRVLPPQPQTVLTADATICLFRFIEGTSAPRNWLDIEDFHGPHSPRRAADRSYAAAGAVTRIARSMMALVG